jgi:hypothetical protein
MTNYTSFPKWRKNGIVIKFNERQYSWSVNSQAQRKYLLDSKYCDNAIEFYVWENDTTYSNIIDFKSYLISKQESINQELCPICGGILQYKKNRNTGEGFYGCSNYPECKHTSRL